MDLAKDAINDTEQATEKLAAVEGAGLPGLLQRLLDVLCQYELHIGPLGLSKKSGQ